METVVLWSPACPPNSPVRYSDDSLHFKYGSIGADYDNGLPLRVLQVLPEMFPALLPGDLLPRIAAGYERFGFIQESGKALPIGFSTRTDWFPWRIQLRPVSLGSDSGS